MIRWIAAGFAVLFTLVVAMGHVPSFVTAVHGEDRILFDLFKISLLDDVTHAGTAVAALGAAVHSRRASVLFLTAFRLLLRPRRGLLSDVRRAERPGAHGEPHAQRTPHRHRDRDARPGVLVGATARRCQCRNGGLSPSSTG